MSLESEDEAIDSISFVKAFNSFLYFFLNNLYFLLSRYFFLYSIFKPFFNK